MARSRKTVVSVNDKQSTVETRFTASFVSVPTLKRVQRIGGVGKIF